MREAKEKATRARQRQERFAKQDDSENGSNEKKGSKGKKKGEKKGSKGSEGTDGEMPSYVPQVYLTESVYQVVLQKWIPTQIRQLVLYIGNRKRDRLRVGKRDHPGLAWHTFSDAELSRSGQSTLRVDLQ